MEALLLDQIAEPIIPAEIQEQEAAEKKEQLYSCTIKFTSGSSHQLWKMDEEHMLKMKKEFDNALYSHGYFDYKTKDGWITFNAHTVSYISFREQQPANYDYYGP